MREWQSPSHVRWYRKRTIYGPLRMGVGKILRELCRQFGAELIEGHAMSDHVHNCA